MMQFADHREGDDLPSTGGLALAELPGVLVECEVRSGAVVVLELLSCPLRGRSMGDVEVHDASALVFEDEDEEHV